MLTAITGINWGDEGKGRMVDLISQEYDIVARYQGGNNAGHTVKNERGKFVLNLLPSGILRPNVVCVMGNGMVIDPHHLDGEINKLREQGIEITPANLKISDRATITMPYHVEQDGLEEARLSKTGAQFGSTKRGIAYAYGDKYMKKTLRMGDLLHLDDAVKKRLVTMVDSKNLVMEGSYNAAPISVDEMWAWLEKYAAIFKDYICDVGQYLADADAAGKKVLFEDDATMLVSPVPSVLEELLAGKVGLLDALLSEAVYNLSLGSDTGMVGTWYPTCVLALHASTANENILDSIVEHVSHVEHTRYVWWRDNHCIRFTTIWLRTEKLVVEPVLIPFTFHCLWIVFTC